LGIYADASIMISRLVFILALALSVVAAAAEELQPNQTYAGGTRVEASSHRVSFVVPQGWTGRFGQEAKYQALLLSSNTIESVGIAIIQTGPTAAQVVAGLNEPQDLGAGMVGERKRSPSFTRRRPIWRGGGRLSSSTGNSSERPTSRSGLAAIVSKYSGRAETAVVGQIRLLRRSVIGRTARERARKAPNSWTFPSFGPGTVSAFCLLHGIEPGVGPGNISNAQRARVELGDRAHDGPRSWGASCEPASDHL
jgi:hypothetical protein